MKARLTAADLARAEWLVAVACRERRWHRLTLARPTSRLAVYFLYEDEAAHPDLDFHSVVDLYLN